MTEFCDGCPMRGSMTGPIEGFVSMQYRFDAHWYSGRANERGRVGSLYDENGNISNPVFVTSPRLADMSIESRIAFCDEPLTKQNWLTRRYKVIGCPAVGALAVTDPDLINLAETPLRNTALTKVIPKHLMQ
jgi:hypothetical protein